MLNLLVFRIGVFIHMSVSQNINVVKTFREAWILNLLVFTCRDWCFHTHECFSEHQCSENFQGNMDAESLGF